MKKTMSEKSCRSLNKTRIIKQSLPVRYQYSPGIVFQLKTADMIPFIQAMMDVVKKFKAANAPDNMEILKNTPVHKRLLFRLKLNNQPYQSVIVKAKKIHKLRLMLRYAWMKHHRYGFAEAANLVTAANRGIEVPQLLGYGYIKNRFGLTHTDIVLLEDLGHDSLPILSLLEQNRNDIPECIRLLDMLIPIFVIHYKTGCNNWDINHGSMVYLRRNGDWYPMVLDFEYVVFYNGSSMENLMFMAGQFTQHMPKWIEKKIFDAWLEKLLDAVKVSDTEERKERFERFNLYFNSPVFPHKERQKLI